VVSPFFYAAACHICSSVLCRCLVMFRTEQLSAFAISLVEKPQIRFSSSIFFYCGVSSLNASLVWGFSI